MPGGKLEATMPASTELAKFVNAHEESIWKLWLRRLESDSVLVGASDRAELEAFMRDLLRGVTREFAGDGTCETSITKGLGPRGLGPCSALWAVDLFVRAIHEVAANGVLERARESLREFVGHFAEALSETVVLHGGEHERRAHGRVQSELLGLAFDKRSLEKRIALLTASLEQLPVGIASSDVSGRVLLTSREFKRVLGEEAADHLRDYDRQWRAAAADGRAGDREGPVARAISKGQPVRHELLEIQRPDGRRTIDLSVAPVTGNDVVAAVTVVDDVTDRQRHARHLQRLWDLSRDLLCVVGFDGYLKHVNPACTQMLGHTEQELLTTSLLDLVYPDDRQSTLLELRKSAQGLPTLGFENRCRCKDGVYKWLSWNATPVLEEAVTYAVVRDVSGDRKIRDGQALLARFGLLSSSNFDGEAQLENLARVAVPALADSCLVDIVESDGKLCCVKSASSDPTITLALARLHGISPRRSEYPALSALRTARPSVALNVTADYLRRISNDAKHLEALSALRPKAFVSVPLRHEGDVLGVLTLVMTASAARYAPEDLMVAQELATAAAGCMQRARSFARARDHAALEQYLVAMVSHDLRSPLNAISMTVQGMLSEDPPPKGRRELGLIQRAVDRALHLINDLLDVARAELGGGIPLRPVSTDLTELVETIVEEARASHPDARIEVRAEGDVHGHWDAARIGQAIANVLINALVHGAVGSPATVRVRDAGAFVEVSVHNFGKEIDASDYALLFDAMQRGRSQETVPSGLGLGLFIAKQFVAAHHGTIAVESSAAQGTTFTIRLPKAWQAAKASMPFGSRGQI